MTSRQARKQRRAAERQARKAERKLQQIAISSHSTALKSEPRSVSEPVPSITPECPVTPKSIEEFGPELVAAVGAARARVRSSTNANRAEINRANAAHSTGPQSLLGKIICSRNALKHGLASGELIIVGEDAEDFEALQNSLLEQEQPVNETEKLLVIKIAQSLWLSQRAVRLQNECFTPDGGIDDKRLALMMRYQTTHERVLFKALTELRALRKARVQALRGSVSHIASTTTQQPGSVSQNGGAEDLRVHEIGSVSQNSRSVAVSAG